MDEQWNLIDQLEGALADRDLSKRAAILGRVTDLFMQGSGKFTVDQIDLFDEVLGRLVEQIELTARAAFGSRLARCSDAPGKVIRTLAFDDAIAVAAPVLKHSVRLDDAALAENARTKSQAHLLAISERSALAESVTDVLVDRGDDRVAASTARNPGARFSTSGFSALTRRSKDNGDLALCVWSRPDIPRHELIKLFGQATEIVRRKLEASDPRRAGLIRTAVAQASDEIQNTTRAGSNEHATALAHIQSLHSRGQLDETKLCEFAHQRDFDRTAVALSIMSDLPIGLIERALVLDDGEQVLVIGKAIDLSWETTKSLLLLAPGRAGATNQTMNRSFASYFRLKTKTAQSALQFYRLKQRAGPGSIASQ
jgi:uncharacterized protein (DUF2336 family)